MDNKRECGILMHITSLPSRYGIGDLGSEAYSFLERVRDSGSGLWQILPLNPTGYGNSPYSPRSSFASNELLISIESLISDGYLRNEDVLDYPEFPSGRVDFNRVIEYKWPLLRKAAKSFIAEQREKESFNAFLKREEYWLSDYALFMVLYDEFLDARWWLWPEDYSKRTPSSIEKLKRERKEDIEIYIALQYLFDKQWKALKEKASLYKVRIIGDVPIFVGKDSADTWSHPELFKRNEKGEFNKVSGVPPDSFTLTGQLWGNPVYDWQKHIETDFKWWIERIKRTSETVDVIRIDHFRGFASYYEIDADAKTAEHGVWVKSPGREFFNEIRKALGSINIIAEDLGYMTDDVIALRTEFGFPGMKIAEDGFNFRPEGTFDAENSFLPHNYTKRFVAYTGTHDNNTIKGWFSHLSERKKEYVRAYTLSSSDDDIPWALIRSVSASNADWAVFTMQDLLALGEDARMNTPSTCNEVNWSWRMEKGAFTPEIAERMRKLNELYGRLV